MQLNPKFLVFGSSLAIFKILIDLSLMYLRSKLDREAKNLSDKVLSGQITVGYSLSDSGRLRMRSASGQSSVISGSTLPRGTEANF